MGGGHACEYRAYAWSTGDTRTKQIIKAHTLWRGGSHPHPIEEVERAWQSNCFPSDSDVLSDDATIYWGSRQESPYVSFPGNHCGTDGSSHGSGEAGSMGASVVFIPPLDEQTEDGEVQVASVQVGGLCSSFPAEAAAMWLAFTTMDPHNRLNVYTDSMNVIDCLRKWQRREFLADMRQQKNSDIIMPLLTALNERTAATHIIKIKSHRGMELNELADREAGIIVSDKEARICFPDVPPLDKMWFTWEVTKWDAKLKKDVTVVEEATTVAAVQKRWLSEARRLATARCEQERKFKQTRWVEKESEWLAPFMLTHDYLLRDKWGHNKLHL